MKKNMKQFHINSTTYFNTKKIALNLIKTQLNILYGNCYSFQSKIPELEKILSEKETERMARFLFYEDKICYLAVHALLKKQLSENLGEKEQDIDINYFNNEKPFINGIDLDFNISHSGHLFSFIIANNNKLQVGVDIERIKTMDDMKSISLNYFSDIECAYIFEPVSDETEQLYRFYEVWTCKEAFLKMIGIGLYTDLSKITVTPGINTFDIELPDNFEVNSSQAFIYSKRYTNFIVSVSLSEDIVPYFLEINFL